MGINDPSGNVSPKIGKALREAGKTISRVMRRILPVSAEPFSFGSRSNY
jgi:hypothetical protein